MPLSPEAQADVRSYAEAHLPNEEWYVNFFDFVSDTALRIRLASEYQSARYIYKLLEGIRAAGHLRRAQIKLQVLQYASIYEALIHHILFDRYRDAPQVEAICQSHHRARVDVSRVLRAKLVNTTGIADAELVVTRETVKSADITKIRFETKADVAAQLGLVTSNLKRDLVEVFSARNAIHLQAEIKKNLSYQLGLSKKAYERMQPLKQQIVARLASDGKL